MIKHLFIPNPIRTGNYQHSPLEETDPGEWVGTGEGEGRGGAGEGN